MRQDFFQGLFSARAPDVRLRARTQTFGDMRAELNAMFRFGLGQRLSVGVRHDEIHALQLGRDHVVDRIAARPADTEHSDSRTQFRRIGRFELDRHFTLLGLAPFSSPRHTPRFPNESVSYWLNHPSSPPVNRESQPLGPDWSGKEANSGLRTSGGIVAPAIKRPMAVA